MALLWLSGFWMGCAAGIIIADVFNNKDVTESEQT